MALCCFVIVLLHGYQFDHAQMFLLSLQTKEILPFLTPHASFERTCLVFEQIQIQISAVLKAESTQLTQYVITNVKQF